MARIAIQYLYQRREAFPFCEPYAIKGMEQNELDSRLSRHHIIAFPYMYALGVIVVAYLYRYRMERDSRIREIEDFYKYYYGNETPNGTDLWRVLQENHICHGDRNRLNFTQGNCVAVFNRLAWTPENIFLGPAGKFREDDPGQECEQIPLSMRCLQTERYLIWVLYEKYRQVLCRQKSTLAMRTNETGYIEIEEQELVEIGKVFLHHLAGKRALGGGYRTLVCDWVARRYDKSSQGNRSCFLIDFEIGAEERKAYNEKTNAPYKNYHPYVLRLARNSSSFIHSSMQCISICQDMYVVIFGIVKEGNIYAFKGMLKDMPGSGISIEHSKRDISSLIKLLR